MIDAPDRLRIVTYNIYKAHYLDRPSRRGGTLRDDFARLAVLGGADVLAVQETIRQEASPQDILGELVPGSRQGVDSTAHACFHGVPHGAGRRWGVALATRNAARFETLDLPRPFWSPWQRGAVLARLGPWIVVTVHLEVWPIGAAARRRQMRAVLVAIDRMCEAAPGPVVVAGDFNCERGGPHLDLARAGFRSALAGTEPTWAFGGLRLRLDHIYVRGARVVAAGIEHQAQGSDHWPLWADLAL